MKLSIKYFESVQKPYPLLLHICSLFSIETKELPSQWKLANVIRIPKPKVSTISDLRPISLLSTIVKILQKFVLSSVKEEIINSYDKEQFDFKPQCSTLHAQIKIHDSITLELDRNEVNGVTLNLLDLSKVFDILRHSSILESLQSVNLQWIDQSPSWIYPIMCWLPETETTKSRYKSNSNERCYWCNVGCPSRFFTFTFPVLLSHKLTHPICSH